MATLRFYPKNIVLLAIIVIVAALRLASFYGVGPLTLFSPVGAMALFGSAYFKDRITPFLFPLLTLFISDLIVSFTLFPQYRVGLLYSGWYWTYSAFALMILAGKYLLREVNVRNTVLAIIAATLIHWVVTDFGMCIQENTFTMQMYIEKLGTAIPYELRFMAGTALYCALMFGSFEFLSKRYPSLKLKVNPSI
jgi:uncharacterized protein DUF6580